MTKSHHARLRGQ